MSLTNILILVGTVLLVILIAIYVLIRAIKFLYNIINALEKQDINSFKYARIVKNNLEKVELIEKIMTDYKTIKENTKRKENCIYFENYFLSLNQNTLENVILKDTIYIQEDILYREPTYSLIKTSKVLENILGRFFVEQV